MDEITALWQEAEQHLREFERLARRTVEEAWSAGDALARIKAQLPHGAWTPALKERGIPARTAQRFIRLRQTYPQMRQLVVFDSVTAALTDKKSEKVERDSSAKTTPVTAYLVSADDLWDWERGEVSTLARRLLSEEELQEFSANVTGEIRFLVDSFTSEELASAGLSREYRTTEGRPQRDCRDETAAVHLQRKRGSADRWDEIAAQSAAAARLMALGGEKPE